MRYEHDQRKSEHEKYMGDHMAEKEELVGLVHRLEEEKKALENANLASRGN